ncbi:hypothetical protein BME96_12545 [Virgibacillus halodenitrificans]|uniref:Uncharacterized protein n=1 Tax=Virgibacillus halodenitrificans TaxID=1482 RepID=A0AAC9NLR4_VIRHA|nr:hypothetical protein [Virgibacillus halodenitrificans]APC48969.1 hypothetical protein BME96_12545 [Virgibacillus halodenitrificans]UUG68585.1 hypothetical protein YPHTV1_00023 [Halomonas phage YPHTV-1]
MRVMDHLSSEQKKALGFNRHKKKPPSKKIVHQERLSAAELEELMGINRDTYKRVRGKWRQR